MQVKGDGQVARLLKAAAMQPPGAGSATQSWPAYDKDAPPVHLPVEKDAVRLQVRCLLRNLSTAPIGHDYQELSC